MGSTGYAKPKTPGYPERVIQWTVGEGETCGDIAVALYGAARHAHLIERYSGVQCRGSLVLKAGMTLVVPAEVTSLATAQVQSIKPEVRAKPPGGGWETAAPGMPLHQRYSVNTREEARADIRFIDRTRIFLSERTLVVIYGTARQSQVARSKELTVELESGELQAGLAAIAGKQVEIGVAGGGQVSAASRDAVVRKNTEKRRTTVSVFDGQANVHSGGARVTVPKNHGSAFVDQKAPSEPAPLPPPPSYRDATSPIVVLASAGQGGLIRGAWSKVPRASAYRVELSADPEFHEILVREEVGAEILDFRAENMPVGRYYLRVRAIDVDDFLGIASVTRAVSVVAVKGGGSGSQGVSLQGEISVHRYQSVELEVPKGLQISLDDGPFLAAPKAIDFGIVTPQVLRFRGVGEEQELSVKVKYAAPEVEMGVTRLPDGGFTVSARFTGIEAEAVSSRVKPRARVLSAARDGRELGVELPSAAFNPGEGDVFVAQLPAMDADHLALVLVDDRGRRLGEATWDAPGMAPLAAFVLPEPKLGVSLPLRPLHPALGTRLMSPARRAHAAVSGGMTNGGVGQLWGEVSGSTGRSESWPQLGFDALLPSNALRDGDAERVDNAAWLGASLELFAPFEGEGSFGLGARVGVPTDDQSHESVELALSLGREAGKLYWLTNLGVRMPLAEAYPHGDMKAFWLFGAGYELARLARLYAQLDVQLLVGDEAEVPSGLAPRGGLGAGIELGAELFVNLGARVAPTSDLDNPLLVQLGAGYRGF
ncbi:MAG: FecR domain-containing protein [Polyangiaceae bacterium]|nr:FecR domain-containing protein [Polyangiaceae bacterium]